MTSRCWKSGAAAEVAKRHTLWEEGRFEDLLRRAEELSTHRKAGKRKQRDAQPHPLARADRARRLPAARIASPGPRLGK